MIHTKNAHLDPKCRSDFILWVMANSPRRDIARIMDEGEIEVLGGFDLIPPTPHPGWIIRIISKHKKEYHVAVVMDEELRILIVWKMWSNDVPWVEYNGKPNRGFWCVYDGDKPLDYLLKKVRAIRGRRKEISKT